MVVGEGEREGEEELECCCFRVLSFIIIFFLTCFFVCFLPFHCNVLLYCMYHDDDVDTPQENIERDVEVVTESLCGAFIERDQFQFTELWS